MSQDQTPVDVRITEKGPWWLHVLDKHGITTVFSLALLYGAYELSQRHFEFLDSQVHQMDLQTKALEVIARSSIRQEQQLDGVGQKLDKVGENMMMENANRKREHEKILEHFKQNL